MVNMAEIEVFRCWTKKFKIQKKSKIFFEKVENFKMVVEVL